MNHQIRIGLFGITLAGALAMTSPCALARSVSSPSAPAARPACTTPPASRCAAPQSRRGEAGHQVQRTLHRRQRDQHRGVAEGEYDFGFIQSDHQHKALQGLAPFDRDGAVDELRAVFSLQSEILTVVVREDSGIRDLDGTEGKRVNIGVPGSGSRDTFEEVMKAKGWSNASFARPPNSNPRRWPRHWATTTGCHHHVVGHPSGAIQEALTNVKARIIRSGRGDRRPARQGRLLQRGADPRRALSGRR